MRPRQRLRSTASQATLNTSSVVDSPAFSRSTSPQSVSDRLASQLPRSDNIALSDTSGLHSRRSSIGSQATFQTAEYPHSAPSQTPVKRRRASSSCQGASNYCFGNSSSNTSSPKRKTSAAQQQQQQDGALLTEQEEEEEEGQDSGVSLQVPKPDLQATQGAPPEPVARLRVEPAQQGSSTNTYTRRSWFGVPYTVQRQVPAVNETKSSGEPESHASSDSPVKPPSPMQQEPRSSDAPTSSQGRPEETQKPAFAQNEALQPGWLSWIGLGGQPQQQPDHQQEGTANDGRALGGDASDREAASSASGAPPFTTPPETGPVQTAASSRPTHRTSDVHEAQTSDGPAQTSMLSSWSRWTGTRQPSQTAPAQAKSLQCEHSTADENLESAALRASQIELDGRQPETRGEQAPSAQTDPSSDARWFSSWRSAPVKLAPNTQVQDTSSSASAAAVSEAAVAPEPAKAAPSEPPVQENALLSAVPVSTWSSWFSMKYASPNKRVTNAEPESMEVEFPPELATAPPPPPPPQEGSKKGAAPPSSQPPRSVPMAPSKGSQSSFFGLGSGSSNSRPASVRSQGQAEGPEPPRSNPAKPLTKSSSSSEPAASAPASSSVPTVSTTSAKGKQKATTKPAPPPMPNLLLPSFEDTFDSLPRSLPPSSKSLAASAARRFGSALWGEDPVHKSLRKSTLKNPELDRLPRKMSVLGLPAKARLSHARKFVVLTTHGWFAGPLMRTLFGEPTGTSVKFATMQTEALKSYFLSQGRVIQNDDVTVIPLEGEGKVEERVHKLAASLEKKQEWLDALAQADCIFVATHSQGSVVSTHLLERLIREGKVEGRKCSLLCLAAISQGPFASLNGNYSTSVYFNFDAPARELFEFQLGTSVRSIKYREALTYILNANARVLLCASLSDQVVPLYSGMFTSFSHPNLLRSVFIDGQSFRAVDFMSNLVCFAVRVRNAGLSDHGLMEQLSEALAGALSGSGHSVLYDDPQPYIQAIRFFFESDIPPAVLTSPVEPTYEPHNARVPPNPYILPWALRGLLEDPQISKLFVNEISELREQFDNWSPTSKRLQDVRYRLSAFGQIPRPSSQSKL